MNNAFENIIDSTKAMVRSYFSGDYEPYFKLLTNSTVYVTGGVTIKGSAAIVKHLTSIEGAADILNDEYTLVNLTKDSAVVLAEVTTIDKNDTRQSNIQFTFVYKLVDDKPKLAYQHNSYNIVSLSNGKPMSPVIAGSYYALIHSILLERTTEKRRRILFHSAGESVPADPLGIIYLCGTYKRVEVVCVGRIFTTDMPLKEVIKMLPAEFCKIHRSYIVNVNYITSIKRCQVELANGEKLPVPAAGFTKVRRQLLELMDLKKPARD